MSAYAPCSTCGKKLQLYSGVAFEVTDEQLGISFVMCSIDCLLDWARKFKEAQPKLSKSR